MENSTGPSRTMPTLEEVQKSFQRFGLADYIVFAAMLIGCSAVGLFYALKSKRGKNVNEEDEYLMGGRNMSLFPVSMSLIASFISGITLLGVPTEVYLHGTQYMYCMVGLIVTGFIASYLILPIFHDLQLSSTYEYLRRRFDKKVQLIGSVLFAVGLTCWLPIVIYVPALAFNQVTGVNVHIVTPVVCIICIFYTSVGGLKAVVWTDVIQTFVMVGAIIIIMVKGTLDIGGLGELWKINMKGGRLEAPELSMDPTIRHSFSAITFGMTFFFIQNGVVNQNMIQRYLTLPTKQLANRALWIFIIGCCIFVFICGYCGLLAYATYHDCDPLTTGLATAKDQVLPLLVMKVFGEFPGLPGLFVAGVFSAALRLSMDPTIRHSFSAITFGIMFHFIQNGVVNQNMIQRYLTLPTKQLATRALWIFIMGCCIFVFICGYCGLLAYATYHDCDPLTTGLATAKDQVLPLLVMKVFGEFPGLPGLFVAGVFSAALSSLSTGLNSMSAVVLEDFVKPYRKTPLSERAVKYILRGVVVIFGCICVALVFVVEQLGQVLQLSVSLQSVSSGACFGIFASGFLIPSVNAKGAFWGAMTGMILNAIIVGGAQRALAVGDVVYPNKETSIAGCDYSFPTILTQTIINSTIAEANRSNVFPLYRISYLFYTVTGGTITIIAALIISYATGGNDLNKIDPMLFSPCIRRWLPKRVAFSTPEEKELIEILHKTETTNAYNYDSN